ncbi:enoyl-CoA hydratase/isomerase family protein [Halorarum halophilum]|uniref:Enoyl-CoA hydratase/isomerase family protein n=1 Tax=Halorarum halophilum TaxID=2743090 RepID=A0A7D5GBL2_9EURY|nr:enoyl-CoA hydratase-related protein [Halobaculum halophilum]QLG27465.1 enoyl-CoA hydratase/isomerase family protein [Halobaculum halophilum]
MNDARNPTGTDAVRLERDADAGVARIVIATPERRNALSVEVTHGIVAALEELEGGDTRCVVLEGEGPAFSAGGDVSAMLERHENDEPLDDAVRHIIQDTGRCIRRVYDCEFPTVAKLDGPAFGAGANLAVACDVQLMSEGARIGFGFRDVGLAVDSGTSFLLPKLVGTNVAKELVFTGELLDADRALDLGVVNHVFPADEFEERAAEFVEEIASGPSVALRTSKRLLNSEFASLEEAIEHEAGAQSAAFASADHAEGIEAFREKRDPEFEGR